LARFIATFGIKQPKGGKFIVEQTILEAPDAHRAFNRAHAMAYRGEQCFFVEPIPECSSVMHYA